MLWTSLYTILVALTPSILWLTLVVAQDIHQEKKQDLVNVFMVGIFTAAPVLIVVYLIFGLLEFAGIILPALAQNFISGALVEETIKLFMLYRFAMQRKFFDEPIDILIYSATLALGFATIENIFFAFSSFAQIGLETLIVMRGLTAVIVHIISTFFMGYYLYQYQETRQKRMLLFGGCVGIGFHGLYNVVVSTSLPSLFMGFYALGFIPAGIAILVITEHLKQRSTPEPIQQ